MKLIVVSAAPVIIHNNIKSAYEPYVKEMNIWFKYFDNVVMLCPTDYNRPLLKNRFKDQDIHIISLKSLYFGSLINGFISLVNIPLIIFKLYKAMQQADHIHLRCPGNIALLGCIVQLFFPHKQKTAKYAGNWDPNARQPWSYNLQKWILNNPLLTKNMRVLVYGEWPNQSINIKSFFTASYSKIKKVDVPLRKYDLPFRFLFVGTLSQGKRPLYALELVNALIQAGLPSELYFYGDGEKKQELKNYIHEHNLNKVTFVLGNKTAEEVEEAYKKSHFLILPSQSEGWPKVIAEAMWWGVVPIATPVSCVSWMLGRGARGLLLTGNLMKDVDFLLKEMSNKNALRTKSNKAQLWSRQYTLEDFDNEIAKLLT